MPFAGFHITIAHSASSAKANPLLATLAKLVPATAGSRSPPLKWFPSARQGKATMRPPLPLRTIPLSSARQPMTLGRSWMPRGPASRPVGARTQTGSNAQPEPQRSDLQQSCQVASSDSGCPYPASRAAYVLRPGEVHRESLHRPPRPHPWPPSEAPGHPRRTASALNYPVLLGHQLLHSAAGQYVSLLAVLVAPAKQRSTASRELK